MYILATEAVVRRCSVNEVLLEISQNSQENTCVRDFFNKVAGLTPATLLKKRLWYRCFPVNFAKFLRTPSVAASVASYILHFYLKTIYNSSICILLSIIKNIR